MLSTTRLATRPAFWLVLLAAVPPRLAGAQGPSAVATRTAGHTVEKFTPVFSLAGHGDRVYTVPFSPGGDRVASASSDQTVRIWETGDAGKPTLTLKVPYQVYCTAFSPDGKRLATAGGHWSSDDQKRRPGEVKLWDPGTGRELLSLPKDAHSYVVFRVAFSPDGKRLATASADKSVKVWDATTGQPLLTLGSHATNVYDVAFSPDGQRLVSAGGDFFSNPPAAGEAKVWDLAAGRELTALKGHTGPVYSAVFSPDGRQVATAGGDHTVKLWDAATGREQATLKGHPGAVYHLAFSPDGRFLVSVGGGKDGSVKVWNLSRPALPFSFQGHGKEDVYGVAFSPDGKRLATGGGDHAVRVWNLGPLTEALPTLPATPARQDLEPLWTDLGAEDTARVYRALWTLAGFPRETVPFLHERLQPPTVADPRITQLIADLNSDTFAVRDKAHRELEKMGPAAEPALRRTLANPASQEVRRRVERLLDHKNQQPVESPEVQRLFRVVKLLEHFGTPEARKELETISKGTFGKTIAQEAQDALERLEKDSPGAP